MYFYVFLNKTYRSKAKYHDKLIVVALDFKKAYDSIDGKKFIELLGKYKINPYFIDIIAKVYSGDETIVKMGEREERIKVTSGVRQGCTASTVLFKIITYEIIKELDRRGEGFIIGGMKLSSLFFADDSTLLTNTVEAAERNVRVVREVSRIFGLEIN